MGGGSSSSNPGQNGNYERLNIELQKTREGYGVRNDKEAVCELMRAANTAEDADEISMSPEEFDDFHKQQLKKACEDRLKEFEDEVTEFGGKPAQKYIIQKNTEHWIAKRRVQSSVKDTHNRKHVEFAKNLFISWDDDGSGILEPGEIIKPMIGLGLSTDHHFAKKIIQALDQKQKAANQNGKSNFKNLQDGSDTKISLHDFIKIFKDDKMSDHLVEIINQDVLAGKQSSHLDSFHQKPAPGSKSSTASVGKFGRQENPQKITLSLRLNESNKIVELPFDKDGDEISVHQQVVSNGLHKIKT